MLPPRFFLSLTITSFLVVASLRSLHMLLLKPYLSSRFPMPHTCKLNKPEPLNLLSIPYTFMRRQQGRDMMGPQRTPESRLIILRTCKIAAGKCLLSGAQTSFGTDQVSPYLGQDDARRRCCLTPRMTSRAALVGRGFASRDVVT